MKHRLLLWSPLPKIKASKRGKSERLAEDLQLICVPAAPLCPSHQSATYTCACASTCVCVCVRHLSPYQQLLSQAKTEPSRGRPARQRKASLGFVGGGGGWQMETIPCSPHPRTANLAQVKALVYAQQTPTPQCARRLKRPGGGKKKKKKEP